MSESTASGQRGRPLSVLRVIDGRERLQPNPNGPFPAPESYDSGGCGPNPERPGLDASSCSIPFEGPEQGGQLGSVAS
jgi:hypothetical protein